MSSPVWMRQSFMVSEYTGAPGDEARRVHCGKQGHRAPGGKAVRRQRSTVHKDVSQRLKYLDSGLYRDVKNVLAVNKAQRHIRGGMATKKKYQAMK